MVRLFLISFVQYMPHIFRNIFAFMTAMTRKPGGLCARLSDSWSARESWSQRNITPRTASLDWSWWRSTGTMVTACISAGVKRNKWYFKNQADSIENEKARTTNSGFSRLLRRSKIREKHPYSLFCHSPHLHAILNARKCHV